MPIFEDKHGIYIMNSRYLPAVERLVKMGVHSLKIEGRTRLFYYCARTTKIQGQVIKDTVNNKPFYSNLNTDLEQLAHREYTEDFLQRHRHGNTKNNELIC